MKIGFASNDWSRSVVNIYGHPVMGGSGHIRIGQYMKYLRQQGVDTECGILAQNNMTGTFGIHCWNGVDHFDCDVIVMQRYMHMQALTDLIRAKASGQIILQDVDDWYWGLSPLNAAYEASLPSRNPRENTDWYRDIIKASDGIIASTDFLYDKMKLWNENTRIHKNHVEANKYASRVHTNSTEKIVVGWMGSTSHRSGDLEILRPHAQQISEYATWHHTGHISSPHIPTFSSAVGANGSEVSVSAFLPPEQLHLGFNFDAGIVPLTDIPFNHAKSYIKGIEYACGGVPFVASASPEYIELAEKHGIGVIAKSPKDYVTLLKKFVDPDYRQEVSDNNFKKVKSFDTAEGAKLLFSTIKKLVKAAR